MPIVMLYHPRAAKLDADDAGTRAAPVARFGRVGRISPSELDVDVNQHESWGLIGAPIVTEDGRLLGILSRGKGGGSVTATRVRRVETLLANRGRQGDYAPDVEISQSVGLFVTPVYSGREQEDEERRNFYGAGIETGLCVNWFCPNFPVGFFTSSPRHLDDATVETVQRFQLDLHALARITLARSCRLYLGPGLALSLSEVTASTMAGNGSVHIENDTRGRARALLVLGASVADLFGGSLFLRDVFTVGPDPEVRLDLGMVFGR
jgi:hypothetical protein